MTGNIESKLQAIKEIANIENLKESDINNICNFCDEIYDEYSKLTKEIEFLRDWKSDIIEKLCEYDCNSIEEVVHNAYNKGLNDSKNDSKQELNIAPEQWIDTKCQCGHCFSVSYPDGYYKVPHLNKVNFCPDCGIKLNWKY